MAAKPKQRRVMIKGRKITLHMPNGEKHDAQFAVVDANEIKASHDEQSFRTTVGYPVNAKGENQNSRNYTDDVSLQHKVIDYAANLEPERLITTSRTPSGTPIINKDGIVVSGNNRTMSLKRAMSMHPEKYNEYKNYLKEEISAFGIEPEDIANIEKPILVRIDYDIPAVNVLETDKYNKSTAKSEAPLDKAIKLGKILQESERCKEVISDIVGNYETFSEFYSNSADQKRMLESMVNCNILTSQETNAFYYERGFTEQGKELIENLLAGLVLNKESLIITNDVARKLRSIIITSLPVLSANASLGADSLLPELNEAIAIEGQIKASKLEFEQWINRLTMFGERPTERGLIINRLLAQGRNAFKSAFEKYNEAIRNNSSSGLFGDAPTSEEIFDGYIAARIPSDTLDLIRKTNTNMSAMTAPIAVPEIIEEKPIFIENPFINGNYFKANPSNILAEKGTATSRWGKPVTTYIGTIENLSLIDAPTNLDMLIKDNNPVVSISETPVEQLTDNAVDVIQNIEHAIVQSPKDVASKQRRRVKEKNTNPEPENLTELTESSLVETYTLREVYNMPGLNEQISQDELRAFLWFMAKKGRTINNPEWYEIANISKDVVVSNAFVNEWVQNGILFYYDGDLLPGYEYLSGNVYDKYTSLVQSDLSANVGRDAQHIISTYGQNVYDNQVKALKSVFDRKYDQRLLIKGEGDETGLKLLPTSKFAKNFVINTLIDEAPFKWKMITAKSNKFFGTPEFLGPEESDYNKKTFDNLTLDLAFQYWLRTDRTIVFKQGMNYADIIEYVFRNKQRPQSQASKNFDGSYSPDQKKILDAEVAAYERTKAKAQSEAQRLFTIFLDKQLMLNDKVRLETEWNMRFNNNVKIDYMKIPVAFRMNKFINGQPLDVRPEKREAVAFTMAEGSGLLAYDVGVGKTPSAIFTVSAFLDFGYANRPLIVVPNQTYKQWISEFQAFCGHIKINGLYNLSDKIINEWTNEQGIAQKMPENSVTIVTYEGMKRLGFNEETASSMQLNLMQILSQDTSKMSDKQAQKDIERTNTKIAELVGKSLQKTVVNIEDFGFDYICIDEAHAAKKVFTAVAGEAEEHRGDASKSTRAVQQYKINSGTPSSTAIKAFTICQYVQQKFNGNTQLLTATPFTNSPLEIYSMLSMIAHKKLVEMGLENLTAFFDTFIDVSYELVINAKLNPERRQVIMGYNNLLVLQQLVRRFINHKTGESVNVQRPNKIVLPLKNKVIDGVLVKLPESEQSDSVLPLSSIQAKYMEAIKQYAEGSISEAQMCAGASNFEEEQDEDALVAEGIELDEDALDSDEKNGVRLLKAMNHARNLSLSPYLFDCAGLGEPTAKSYVETSNKLLYTIKCIEQIKKHHEEKQTPMGGVVIYMERGVEYFQLVRQYLIDEVGFESHEVGIISSKTKIPSPSMPDEAKKEYIKNLFLGKKFNESTGDFDKLSDKDRMKVLIGSSTIREGINLQAYSSTLFNLFLPWNPTDVQQLEGRIYRQGNAFNNVRIVNPLMIDSIDIFMFQKLEEKTSRINSVWETDGYTNVLKTEEFNPKELKYSLIKNPRVIAQMELIEDKERLDETKVDLENKIKRLDAVGSQQANIAALEPKFREWLQPYRPKDADKPLEQALKSAQLLLKNQTDGDGLPMVYRSSGGAIYGAKYDDDGNEIKYSPLQPVNKQYYQDTLVSAVRFINRFERDFLIPTNRTLNELPQIRLETVAQLEQIQAEIEELKSENLLQNRTEAIIQRRLEMNYKEKSLDEVVAEFSRLNYLLDDVKLPKTSDKVIDSCPVVDANGVPRIDLEAIRAMDECTKRQVQTRDLHATRTEVDGQVVYEYTPERKKLHDHIYKTMTSSAICVKQTQPIAILMGGAPGSGKSSFLKKNAAYMTSDLIWKIDTDEIREFLPEYEGWNAGATHEEASMITNRLLAGYDQPCTHDVLYDGTMGNVRKYIPIIKQLHSDGYKVFIAYMQVPKEVSIERAMKRYRDNNDGHRKYGRYVPLFVIDEFFKTGDAAFQQIKEMVDGYIKVDSLTGAILERGGEEIPKTRPYYKVFEDQQIQEQVQAPKPPTLKKVENTPIGDVSGAIDALKILQKFADAKTKKQIKGAIDALIIIQKYSK